MPIPLIPVVAGLGGATVGALAGGAVSKKGPTTTTTTTYSPTTTSTITDARAYNIQYPTYQVQIDSPFAGQTTKKEATASAQARPRVDTTGATTKGGTDLSILLPVALIIGVAVVSKEVLKK